MASSVSKRVRVDGTVTWWVRWRDPASKQRSKSFPRRTDADRFRVSLEADRARGLYLDPHDRTTVGEFGGRWLAGQVQLAASSAVRSGSVWRNQVEPRWARVPLAAVGHADVQAWVLALSADGLAASSVRKAVGQLSQILAAAVRDGRVGRNVCGSVQLPRLPHAEPRFLTVGEVDALADACGDTAVLVRLLAFTGLRFGEAAGLRIDRLDLLRRRAAIVEHVVELEGREVWEPLTKSHRARTVPIPGSLVEELAALAVGQPRTATVFRAPEGGVLSLRNWRRRTFDPAVRAVGLGGLTPHDLRHTAASLAIRAGATVKGVQTMLGHASAAMTLDVYAGQFPDDLEAVSERVDAAVTRARVIPVRTGGRVVDLAERRASS